jgi:hypothetical protein
MKYIIFTVIVLGALLGGSALIGGEQVVQNTVTEYVNKEVKVEVNPLDEMIKAREAELEEKYNKIQELEAERDVLVIDVEKKEARIREINKELSGFMTGTQ